MFPVSYEIRTSFVVYYEPKDKKTGSMDEGWNSQKQLSDTMVKMRSRSSIASSKALGLVPYRPLL